MATAAAVESLLKHMQQLESDLASADRVVHISAGVVQRAGTLVARAESFVI